MPGVDLDTPPSELESQANRSRKRTPLSFKGSRRLIWARISIFAPSTATAKNERLPNESVVTGLSTVVPLILSAYNVAGVFVPGAQTRTEEVGGKAHMHQHLVPDVRREW